MVFFARNTVDDYDSDDDPQSPKNSKSGSPQLQQGTLSSFARTLLGKYLEEDDTVEVGCYN